MVLFNAICHCVSVIFYFIFLSWSKCEKQYNEWTKDWMNNEDGAWSKGLLICDTLSKEVPRESHLEPNLISLWCQVKAYLFSQLFSSDHDCGWHYFNASVCMFSLIFSFSICNCFIFVIGNSYLVSLLEMFCNEVRVQMHKNMCLKISCNYDTFLSH